MSKLRVLLLVAESWRCDDSGGNTLNNFLEGMKGVEFMHVFCDDRMPDNTTCELYFQFPEIQIFRNFIIHKQVGQILKYHPKDNGDMTKINTVVPQDISLHGNTLFNKIKRILKKQRLEIVFTIRNMVWLFSNWKTPTLQRFITEFNPDVIYAPCYANPFQLALTRYVKELTGCKVISWSADDCYSLRHFSLDPFFWINRLWNRHCLRKTYPYYDEFYSISEEEAEELEPVVGKKIGILRKGVHVPDTYTPREIHKPIRFIYAGGLYLNRHKSLIKIADALRKLNMAETKAELHIYSGNQLDKKSMALLNDGCSSYMHGLISPDELTKIYQESDVAIHCESFDLKYRLMTRLSFSTKIIDCFQSGCAILAIAWEEHTGIKCLQREDAAICVTSVKEIEEIVTRIVEYPEIVQEYSRKAYECEKRNHRIEDVQNKLFEAFVRNSKNIVI